MSGQEFAKNKMPGSLIVFPAITKFIQHAAKIIKLPPRKILTYTTKWCKF